MPQQSLNLSAAIGGLAACAVLGGYGTFGGGFKSGLFPTISHNTGHHVATPWFPTGPKPYKTTFTGIAAVDRQLFTLVAFFTFILDGPQTWDVAVSYWYLLIHFFAAWCLLSLEGWRKGNRKGALGWTTVMGLVVQNASYTITVPLYLIAHLLASPVANPTTNLSDALVVEERDASLLSVCATLAFIVPAIMMYLPTPSFTSPLQHYSWIALWQVFPLTQSLLHWAVKLALGSSANTGRSVHRRTSFAAAASIYRYVLVLCIGSQLAVLALALIPASAVSPRWSTLFSEAGLWSIFVPWLPGHSPTVDHLAVDVKSVLLAELTRMFFQWDIYCGGAAVLIWATYLRTTTRPFGSTGAFVGKILLWTILGGPVAAAAVLLWERDELTEVKKKNA